MKIMLLEVSIGEAIDKLTILNIKAEMLTDNHKIEFVQKEREYIKNHLSDQIQKFDFLIKCLTKINKKIWILQDKIRLLTNTDSEYSTICEDIILLNDARFIIKNKINQIESSKFQEQKGYNKRSVYFLGHLGLGDNITMIGFVRYLSLFYDQVYVISKKYNAKNVKSFYSDDPSIQVIEIDTNKYPEPLILQSLLSSLSSIFDQDVFVSGICHTKYFKSKIKHPFFLKSQYQPNPRITYKHISDFYQDLNIDANVYHEYFYLPITEGAVRLLKKISKFSMIVFCQTVSSNKTIEINIDEYKNQDSTIVVDSNKNLYSNLDGEKYNIANSLLNHPILDYLLIIQNADVIKVVDSSFSCMIMPLLISNQLQKCKTFEIINR